MQVPVYHATGLNHKIQIHCGVGPEFQAFKEWVSNSTQAQIRAALGVGKASAWRLAHGFLVPKRWRAHAVAWEKIGASGVTYPD
jgi:hypothetical protein